MCKHMLLFFITQINHGLIDIMKKTMATATATLSSFHVFGNLPLELREQIWYNALPEDIPPALYPFTMGCWHSVQLTESDPYGDYDPEDEIFNLRLEFRHEMLGHVQVNTPLVFVNHEARRVAVAWAHEKSLLVINDQGYPLFGSPFNPGHDILYIADDYVWAFLVEAMERPFEDDMVNRNYSIRSFVEHIAFSEQSIHICDSFLSDLFEFFSPGLQTLVAIIGTLPKEISDNDGLMIQKRWELVDSRGAFVWPSHNGDCEPHVTGREEFYRRMEEGREQIMVPLRRLRANSEFEIQSALVIRK